MKSTAVRKTKVLRTPAAKPIPKAAEVDNCTGCGIVAADEDAVGEDVGDDRYVTEVVDMALSKAMVSYIVESG